MDHKLGIAGLVRGLEVSVPKYLALNCKITTGTEIKLYKTITSKALFKSKSVICCRPTNFSYVIE